MIEQSQGVCKKKLLVSAVSNYISRDIPIGANDKTLRVSFPFYEKSLTNLNPQVIQTAAEVILVQNMYSRVIDLHDGGQIKGDMATDIKWTGGEYILTIGEYKTAKGTVINAEDVYFSLLRIIANNHNTHGSLKSFLCPDKQIRNLNEKCEGLSFNENEIVIKPVNTKSKQFALSLLGATDFSIIPKGQLDFDDPSKLKLDFSDTTGPYYLLKDDSEGKAILGLSVNHDLSTSQHFGKLQLVPGVGEKALKDLSDGVVDYITTISLVKVHEEPQKLKDYTIYKSDPFMLYYFAFTDRAMRSLEEDERLALGNYLKELAMTTDMASGATEASQFFPVGAEGRLAEERANELVSKIKSSVSKINLEDKKYQVMVFSKVINVFKDLFKDAPNIEIVPFKGLPWLLPEEEQPDAYFAITDSSFYANLPLLSYNFSNSTFGFEEDGEAWINDFVEAEEGQERLDKLKDLHYKFLSEGCVVPLFFSYYAAITSQPLNLNFSKLSSWNLFSNVTLKKDDD